MNSTTEHEAVNETLVSAGYGTMALRALSLLAVLLIVVGGVRWGLGYSPTLDVAVGTFFDVVGILVALTAVGVAVYNVVDFVVSRRERRKYHRIMATGRRRRLAAAATPAIAPPRQLVEVTEQMTRGEVEAS